MSQKFETINTPPNTYIAQLVRQVIESEKKPLTTTSMNSRLKKENDIVPK